MEHAGGEDIITTVMARYRNRFAPNGYLSF